MGGLKPCKHAQENQLGMQLAVLTWQGFRREFASPLKAHACSELAPLLSPASFQDCSPQKPLHASAEKNSGCGYHMTSSKLKPESGDFAELATVGEDIKGRSAVSSLWIVRAVSLEN